MENQNLPNNGQNDFERKAAEGVKKAGKDVGTKLGKKFAKKVAKIIIGFFAKLAAIVGMPIIFILGFVVLAIIIEHFFTIGTSNSLTNTTVEQGQNVGDENKGQVRTLVTIDEANRKYTIDSEIFINYVDELLKSHYSTATGIGISEDYIELKKFMEAEIVTSFPDLRKADEIGTEVPEGEIQGCVQFSRKDKDGVAKLMEFMPFEDFAKEVAKMGCKISDEITQGQTYTTPKAIEDAYEKMKFYFTIDNDANVYFLSSKSHSAVSKFSPYAEDEEYYHKIANPEEPYHMDVEEDYFKVDCKPVNYQDEIQKYCMPFDFLFALQMTTKNNGYTSEVVKMAKHSKIIYEIQENVTTSEKVIKTNWVSHFRVSSEYEAYTTKSDGSQGHYLNNRTAQEWPTSFSTSAVDEGYDCYEEMTIGDMKTNLNLVVTYVDSWIAYVNMPFDNDVDNDEELKLTEKYSYGTIDYKNFPKWCHGIKQPDATDYGDPRTDSSEKFNDGYPKVTGKIEEKRELITAEYYVKEDKNTYEPSEDKTVIEDVVKFLSLLAVDPELLEEDVNGEERPVFNCDNVFRNNKGLQEYEGINGFKSKPVDAILHDRGLLIYELQNMEKTKDIAETMDYMIKVLTGEEKADQVKRSGRYLPNPKPVNPDPNPNPDPYPYPGDIRYRLWWAVKDMLAEHGIENDIAVAAVLGNVAQESGFQPGNLENSVEQKLGYADGEYDRPFTDLVNKGTMESDFIKCDKYGVCDADNDGLLQEYGYGLAQWTYPSRKQNLYNRTIKEGLGIDNSDAQIKLIAWELDKDTTDLVIWRRYFDTWTNTGIEVKEMSDPNFESKIKEAVDVICDHWEIGGHSQKRYDEAKRAYIDFHGTEKRDGGGFLEDNGRLDEMIKDAIDLCNSSEVRYNNTPGYNRGPKTFDCSGFIYYLYMKHFNYDAGDYNTIYTKHENLGQLYPSEMLPGDIIHTLNAKGGHYMLYIGDNKIAHASWYNFDYPDREVAVGNCYFTTGSEPWVVIRLVKQ